MTGRRYDGTEREDRLMSKKKEDLETLLGWRCTAIKDGVYTCSCDGWEEAVTAKNGARKITEKVSQLRKEGELNTFKTCPFCGKEIRRPFKNSCRGSYVEMFRN